MLNALKTRLVRAERSLGDWHHELTRAWQDAEDVLVDLELGRPIAVHLRDEEDPESASAAVEEGTEAAEPLVWSHYLGLAKLGGQWRLCYGWVPAGARWDDDHLGRRKPIWKCRRELQVATAEHLPRLMTAAVEEAERLGSEVEAAVGLLRETVTPFKARS